MADISKITLPSNVTYDVKDTTARSGLANKQDKITAITAQTTQAVYPIKIDSQGHITAYGSAVTIPTQTSQLTNNSGYITSSSAIYESRLNWGNSNISGNVSPVDAGCIDEFGHNKLAFLPAECINAAYSVDGGATWIDYGLSNEQKVSLVTNGSVNVTIGKNETKTASNIARHKSRIRISAQNTSGVQRIYTASKKWLINVTTNGASGTTITMRYRTIANAMSGTETWVNVGTYTVSGWSGWNSIPWINNFGGSTTSQTGQPGEVEFVLSATGLSSSNGTAAMLDIRLIGSTNWKPASELAKNGHVYSFDVNQNVTFPAIVNASSFNGYTIASNVPSGAKFTDTTYGADRGISNVSGNFGHSNTAITAQNTQAVYPIKIDAYGHITGYGSAVTIPAAVAVKGNSESTYRTGNVNLTAANIGAAASSHAHGDITSGGDITATATIASGDRLVINDESASKITNSSITFGTSTTTFLRNNGTWGTVDSGTSVYDGYGYSPSKYESLYLDTIASGTGTGVDMKPTIDLLWENSAPTANFSAQKVSLNLNDYRYVFITAYNSSTGESLNITGLAKIDSNHTYIIASGASSTMRYRVFEPTSSGVQFGTGYRYTSYSSNASAEAGSLIPYQIYGIK